MPVIIEPPEPGSPPPSLPARLGWFFALAVAGALATALVAYGLRAILL